MSAQHTPGPWTVEYDGTICMAGQTVQSPFGPDGAGREEKKANARLIAAAPDLLEVLAEYALLGAGKCTISKAHAEKARAAIAKAMGGAP